jgi:hypothetical protein
MDSSVVDVMQQATEAARNAGAVCPEGVAEFLRDNLTVVDTAAGPQVLVRNGVDCEPLSAVMARMQVTENVAALFGGGKVNVRSLTPDLYRAIRKHKPELIGLRPNRR